MNAYRFERTSLEALACLRAAQTKDLKGQAHDPLEELIRLAGVICVLIYSADEQAGYALIDDREQRGTALLECYVVPEHRRYAHVIISKLIDDYSCVHWLVNTHDAFALPLMIECGYRYAPDCALFAAAPPLCVGLTPDGGRQEDGICVKQAAPDELRAVYGVVMQDGFYTGGGEGALAACISNGEVYTLRSPDALLGVGFISPIARTPLYADIAMIIDRPHRKRGYGARLVGRLISICARKALIPTALTSAANIASRKTLEKCGFYVDGWVLLASVDNNAPH